MSPPLMSYSPDFDSLRLKENALTSAKVKGRVGKQAAIAEQENIAKDAPQPQLDSTGPSKSYPRMLPKPATPSQIPEIVATAFLLCTSKYSLPMSQRIIAITMVAPCSKTEKLVNKNVSHAV